MIEDKYIDDYAADAAAVIGQLQRAAKHNAALSQVTVAKAAETDRLTDENRRLRAKVEEDAHTIESLHGALDDTRKELSATIDSKGAAVRAGILSNEQNQRLAAELANRDSEIAKLKFTIDNLHHELAKPTAPVVADHVDPLHGWTIPAEMLAQVVETTAHEVDGPSGYALMRLAKKLRGET